MSFKIILTPHKSIFFKKINILMLNKLRDQNIIPRRKGKKRQIYIYIYIKY